MARVDRIQAISTLEEGHLQLRRLLSGLTDEQLATPATIGGGEWSAADLAGHVAHWEEIALAALEDRRAGRRPSVEDVFERDAIDEVNAADIEFRRRRPPRQVVTDADDAHRRLIEALEGIGPDEWTARATYETRRRTTLDALLGSVLGAPQRPFGHAFAHLPDLAAYVASLADPAR